MQRYNKILTFLDRVYSAIDRSYEIEFGYDAKEWLYDKSKRVLERAALFTQVKDAYEDLPLGEKKIIDKALKSSANIPHTNIGDSQTIPSYIDYIVGGNEGEGACLQAATSSLSIVYNHLVETLSIGTLFILNHDKYKSLTKDTDVSIDDDASNFTSPGLYEDEKKWEDMNKKAFFDNEPLLTKSFRNGSDSTLFDQIQHLKNEEDPAYELLHAIHNSEITTIKVLCMRYSVSELQREAMHDPYFQQPLHMACQEGKLEIVELLVDRGFDVNLRNKNDGMRTAISYAFENNHVQIIDFLLGHQADMTVRDNDDKKPDDWSKKR